MNKRRFGKYVSRVNKNLGKKYGGSVATAPSTNPPSIDVVSEATKGGSLPPVNDHYEIYDEEESPEEAMLKKVVAEPLVMHHDALAIDHGMNHLDAFHYREPLDIDLHKMATNIARKHSRYSHHSIQKHVGGGLWQDIQHGVADGLTIGGSLGQIIGGTTAGIGTALLATPAGAPLIAAGGAMFSVGTGSKLAGELAGSKIKTPGVSVDKFILGKK